MIKIARLKNHPIYVGKNDCFIYTAVLCLYTDTSQIAIIYGYKSNAICELKFSVPQDDEYVSPIFYFY